MRKTLIFLVIAAAIFISYSIWPFVGVYGLLQAVQTRDMAEINARVDFKELRRSLTEQLVRTYLRLTGKDKNLNSFAQNLVIGAIATVADPIVAKMVSPEALADLLQNGWPTSVVPDRPPGFEGISIEKLGSIWQLYS